MGPYTRGLAMVCRCCNISGRRWWNGSPGFRRRCTSIAPAVMCVAELITQQSRDHTTATTTTTTKVQVQDHGLHVSR